MVDNITNNITINSSGKPYLPYTEMTTESDRKICINLRQAL